MTKLIYEYMATTPDAFIKQEVEEWGYDYVDEMFAKGYEPTLTNGVWCWNARQFLWPVHVGSNTGSSVVYDTGDNRVVSGLNVKRTLTRLVA